MSRTERMQNRRIRSRQRLIETLIWRQDRESPAALDDSDREAISIVLRIALESEPTFQALGRVKGPIRPSDETSYVCNTIRSGLDFFAVVIQTCAIFRGIVAPRPGGALRKLLTEHGKQLRLLQRPNLTLSQQMSALLTLIHINVNFFAQLWVPHLGRTPAPRSSA